MTKVLQFPPVAPLKHIHYDHVTKLLTIDYRYGQTVYQNVPFKVALSLVKSQNKRLYIYMHIQHKYKRLINTAQRNNLVDLSGYRRRAG